MLCVKKLILFGLLIMSQAVASMDMDMSHDHSTVDLSTVDLSTITPVPHEGGHHHGTPILEQNLTPAERLYWEAYNTTTYFTIESPYKKHLTIHMALMLLTNVVIYPVVLILNNIKSGWFLPGLTVHVLLTFISLFSYWIFIGNVPDLFPNNAYSRMSLVLFFLTGFHFVFSIIHYATNWVDSVGTLPRGRSQFIPLEDYSHDGSQSPSSTLYDFDHNGSHDSGMFHLGEGLDEVLSSTETGNGPDMASNDLGLKNFSAQPSKWSLKRDQILGKILNLKPIEAIVRLFSSVSFLVFNILNWGLFVFFLIYLPTGVACLNLMGKGDKIFNLLAHFIKGGVFVLLGIVSLARYCGAFSKLGMAWNFSFISRYEKPESIWFRIQPSSDMITMEMIESSLILFYGSTNIFLEHLAAWGEAWTAKDLQHASIAFMYIGSGLCGVLVERRLAAWRRDKFTSVCNQNNIDTADILHGSPGYSPNPFPAFTIFWTGLLMSQHAQASAVSTAIHVQWGDLLTYGSFFRILTYILLNFTPYYKGSLFNPSRPLTELITSFALLCGGLVFMESTDQIVEAIEYRGLTGMFTLNVSVGVVALVMGWIMTIFSIKDWLKARQLS
ncbi:unnamed protein product [Kuraishia capsulata CBS 1993]|uniref:Protein YTP1-like C-terminal domain-containing protein n=1 Tax=Kuraishia capsulata CBS 1993 TaxID=1382522 RepID=W6MMC8_9ASCO|nr:uncharacterized protein KUCA_T00003718001 [Kuraishia capsulata CBS 1993]CDK27739.1 unnamed protein product [Kuraishia capsulata CBS 1993]